jgi:hypothetical protein
MQQLHRPHKKTPTNTTKMSASAASSAAPAADIYNSKDDDPTIGVVSDVVDNTTSDSDGTSDDDETSNKDEKTEDSMFLRAARDIMNRTGQKVGMAAMEDHRFCSLFGAHFQIVRMVWDMLVESHLLPKKSNPKHLLWMLYFLKVYPREAPGCSAVGGSKGAVDPKTLGKWVWLFLERIAKLANHVVSCFVPSRCHQLSSHLLLVVVALLPKPQIVFKSHLVNDVGKYCLMAIDRMDLKILQKGAAKKGNEFSSHKYAGKSALRYELGTDILAGNLVWVKVLEEEVPTELKVLLTLNCTLTSLIKHTAEDPAPGCLSRRRIAKMIYFKL